MTSKPNRSGRARPEAGGGGVRDRLGGLFARAANRASEGAERLREVAAAGGRSPILQHALAARERGNPEAAFWLLEEIFRSEPGDPDATAAFWDVAVALDRAPQASQAGVALVEASASDGEPDVAARRFAELVEQVPEARVSPAAVARMLPPLCARIAALDGPAAHEARELARLALTHALQEDEQGEPALGPGLAIHLFKEARKVDLAAARRTAEIALASSDLHEVKRSELEQFLAGDEEAARPAQPNANRACEPPGPDRAVAEDPPTPDAGRSSDLDEPLEFDEEDLGRPLQEELSPDPGEEPVLEPLSQDEVDDAARRLADRHGALSTECPAPPDMAGLHVMRAVPVDFEEGALLLQLPGGRASQVGWKEIQALSVVRIGAERDRSVVLIDCILNWRRRQQEPLRLLRFHADDFMAGDLVEGEVSGLTTFLADLFERCRAAPLPDPESALGVRIAAFDDLVEYQNVVLGVGEAA